MGPARRGREFRGRCAHVGKGLWLAILAHARRHGEEDPRGTDGNRLIAVVKARATRAAPQETVHPSRLVPSTDA